MNNTKIAAIAALILWIAVLTVCGIYLWEKVNGSWFNAFDVVVTYVAVHLFINCMSTLWKSVKDAVERL